MKRKITALFLTTALVFSQVTASGLFAAESDEIKIILDETPVEFDQAPVIEEGRTLVPFRAILEAMGIDVSWDSDTKTITCTKDDKTLSLSIGASEMDVDGKKVPLDVPAKTVNGRTLVPIRVISENFDADVNWDGDSKTVEIKSKISESDPSDIPEENQEKSDNDTKKSDNEKSENNSDMNEIKSDVFDIKDKDGTLMLSAEVKVNADNANLNTEILDFLNDKLFTAKEFFLTMAGDSELDLFVIPGNSTKEEDIIQGATEELTEIKALYDENKIAFPPYGFILNYDISETDGLLSVKSLTSLYTGGAHPNTSLSTKIYDYKTGKTLTLKEVSEKLSDKTSEELLEQAKKLFEEKIDANPDDFFEDAKETVKTLSEDNFYLTEKGVVFYFNTYEIAPYAAGIQEVTIELK